MWRKFVREASRINLRFSSPCPFLLPEGSLVGGTIKLADGVGLAQEDPAGEGGFRGKELAGEGGFRGEELAGGEGFEEDRPGDNFEEDNVPEEEGLVRGYSTG